MTTLNNLLHNSATHKPGHDDACPVCNPRIKPAPRFTLGQCCATHGALGALEDNRTFPIVYLKRHEAGDWGDMGDDDKARNEAALLDESRIFSAYNLPDGQRIWVITEAVNDEGQRASTTILLPSKY